MSLGFLQVCRQIYYEAALKPFSENLFSYTVYSGWDLKPGLRSFLEMLVPAQAKAITHLRINVEGLGFLNLPTVAKLNGLEKLDIAVSFSYPNLDRHTLILLEKLLDEPSFKTVPKLRLMSVKILCEVACDSSNVTAADRDDVAKWLELVPSRVLQPAGQ